MRDLPDERSCAPAGVSSAAVAARSSLPELLRLKPPESWVLADSTCSSGGLQPRSERAAL